MHRFYYICLMVVTVSLLSGCFSPKYTRPELAQPIPSEYKHSGNWQLASPQDTLDRGNWWALFQDDTLSRLMGELNTANQRIAIAAANYRKAKAQVASAAAGFLPFADASGDIERSRANTDIAPIKETYKFGVQVGWEASIWNSLAAYESASSSETASAADYAAVKLSMQAELAQTYFQLRVLDVQLGLYESTIAAYAKGVQLTRSQFQGGMVTAADVAQAEAQLASAEAQLADILRQRAELESAIAILTGNIPSSFSLERGSLVTSLPSIPGVVPSTLLERRPDIAAAERRVASANGDIGAARAAWFPKLNLGGSIARSGAELFAAPITMWSLGPSAALNLLQGGKHIAATDAAWAGYEAAAASYKQTVLESFKEVEDSLAGLQYLTAQADAQSRAVRASQMALRLSLSQYRGGMTTYLQVVNTQTAALTNERSAIQVQGQRLIASVHLIKALGGGWDTAAIGQLIQDGGPKEGEAERVW